jgi:uncharacterized repeat protein (TIGR03803 family)
MKTHRVLLGGSAVAVIAFATVVHADAPRGHFPSPIAVHQAQVLPPGVTTQSTANQLPPGPAPPVSIEVLHAFDNDVPEGAIAVDSHGHVYGASNTEGVQGATLGGGVFEISPPAAGSSTWGFHYLAALPQQAPSAGSQVYTGVVRDGAGNLYGATDHGSNDGNGALFKIDTGNHLWVLHPFHRPPALDTQISSLVLDHAGNLFGLGPSTVMEAPAANQGHLGLYSNMCGGAFIPNSLTMASDGILYGVSWQGTVGGDPEGAGVIFSIPPGGSIQCLADFGYAADGNPNAVLPMPGGWLYGTTAGQNAGWHGQIFRWSAATGRQKLHAFTDAEGYGASGGLALGPGGYLYGVTSEGGSSGANGTGVGWGTIFRVSVTGQYTVLHKFAGPQNGGVIFPQGTPVLHDGYLYALAGGGPGGAGVVFRYHL